MQNTVHIVDKFKSCIAYNQGIIDWTRTETVAKDHFCGRYRNAPPGDH